MKKSLIVLALIMASFSAYAQGSFKAGVNGGIPVGDAEEIANFQLGVDVAYMFAVADRFEVGPLVGFSHFFLDDIDTPFGSADMDDVQFLPIAGSGRFGITDSFFLGADLGYAVGISDGNDGGFYYKPQVGYDFGLIGLIASYSGVSMDGINWSSVNLGVEFGL